MKKNNSFLLLHFCLWGSSLYTLPEGPDVYWCICWNLKPKPVQVLVVRIWIEHTTLKAIGSYEMIAKTTHSVASADTKGMILGGLIPYS